MYQHVLLVTDLGDDSDLVAERAKWVLQNNQNCQLTVLHIVEETTMGLGYEMVPISSLPDDIDNDRLEQARINLAKILARNELQVHDIKIKTAISGRQGIVQFCKNNPVDLVIVGRHKRTGLSAWLIGATADSILPNVDSDFLVVQLSL